jgi:hypothetical protein
MTPRCRPDRARQSRARQSYERRVLECPQGHDSQWVAQPDFGRQIGIVAACWLPVLDLRRRLAASHKSDPGGINQSPE